MAYRDLVRRRRSPGGPRLPVSAALGLAVVAAVGASGSVQAVQGSSARTDPPVASDGPPGSAWALTSAGDECLPLTDDDDPEGSLVVLVDGTTSSATQADRVGALVQLVDDTTAERKVSVAVGSFGGSDAEVRFDRCLDGDLFAPAGNNARTRARNRPDLIDGLRSLVAALPSGYGSSDPTSALRAGALRLAASAGETKVLVVHTDGIPTTGCAALPEQVAVDEPGLVERLTQQCVDAGQIPAADGIEIVIGGIGRTDTADGDALGADAVTFLLALNTALCEASGATCHVDPNLPTDAWPTEAEEQS